MEHFLKNQARFPERKFNAIALSFKAPDATILLPLAGSQLPITRNVPQRMCPGVCARLDHAQKPKTRREKNKSKDRPDGKHSTTAQQTHPPLLEWGECRAEQPGSSS